jgi:hypothetical protein
VSARHSPELLDLVVLERYTAAMRMAAVQKRWLLRLVFHAWCAAHSQMCILRNMTSLMQDRASGSIGAAGSCGTLLSWSGLGPVGATVVDSSALRSSAEVEVLQRELQLVDIRLEREVLARRSMAARYDAAVAAVRELTMTAGAMYGRGLGALDGDGDNDVHL